MFFAGIYCAYQEIKAIVGIKNPNHNYYVVKFVRVRRRPFGQKECTTSNIMHSVGK